MTGERQCPNLPPYAMPMDWLNTPVDVPISELIARKKRARMIDALRAQLEGRLGPGVQMRLQLADLLVQAGRGEEAVPVLIGLADEFSADGFVAKAIPHCLEVLQQVPTSC